LYKSEFLLNYRDLNRISSRNLDGAKWNAARKQMRYEQQAVQQGKQQLRSSQGSAAPSVKTIEKKK
jgi:hypothetical protein